MQRNLFFFFSMANLLFAMATACTHCKLRLSCESFNQRLLGLGCVKYKRLQDPEASSKQSICHHVGSKPILQATPCRAKMAESYKRHCKYTGGGHQVLRRCGIIWRLSGCEWGWESKLPLSMTGGLHQHMWQLLMS